MPKKSKNDVIKVPPKYWDDLKKIDMNRVCECSLAISHDSGGLLILFLNQDVLVDIENRCLWRIYPDRREKIDHSLLELVVLVYLLNVTHDLIGREMISVSDLKDAHFFQGPHTLKTGPILKRFGRDLHLSQRFPFITSCGKETMNLSRTCQFFLIDLLSAIFRRTPYGDWSIWFQMSF
ncbi:MAG: DUF3786 domain-containing protein [Deltaproteobacteria bacterium]|nr:DUF3786 domain-containing protein [Deltaproteobacteria bacterium]